MLYGCSFVICLGPLPSIISTEIFSNQHRGPSPFCHLHHHLALKHHTPRNMRQHCPRCAVGGQPDRHVCLPHNLRLVAAVAAFCPFSGFLWCCPGVRVALPARDQGSPPGRDGGPPSHTHTSGGPLQGRFENRIITVKRNNIKPLVFYLCNLL